MNYSKYLYSLLACITFASCSKDVLDRPPLTTIVDEQYWRNEDDIRLYTNAFYPQFFPGYNTGFTLDYAPLRGYNFSDDVTSKNAQTAFEVNIPTSRGTNQETGTAATWLQTYGGPTWNFTWIRKSNILMERLDNVVKPKISTEAYNHWMAVAKFFRGFDYSRLVSVFGDVPYFDKVVPDTDLATLYKDRDNRGIVMDKVYDDFKFVLANIRENDGAQYVNRNIAAAFISRFMLFEGTYQHYHGLDAARAKKYLEFAVDAAAIVMNSNKFSFGRDFKSLFASESLAGHSEVLMYRAYDAALGVMHSIGSYSNGTETVQVDPNLDLVKSFIVNDGNVWGNSTVTNATSFSIPDLVRTRDSRFEATFIDKPNAASTTLLYGYKFASRDAITYIGKTYPAAWQSSTNTNDAPVMRLAEVVLNWIEAKAELAQYHGGPAVSQVDLDKSVNAIRNRPIDPAATAKGVQKTAPLQLAALPNDPERDADVSALIWEIRRERRMEFVFEFSRLLDLKRWKKLNYMNFSRKPDYLLGPWVNVPVDVPSLIRNANGAAINIGRVRVRKANGTVVNWNGSNDADMVGFWVVENASNRDPFTDRAYLAPVGTAQIVQYEQRGFKLTQTKLW
jgi:hypothetical protein